MTRALPPFLIGASLLFWGWQTGNWIAALPLAVALEAVRRASPRFDLGVAEFSRIADLCTIVFVALAALLSVNNGITRGILQAFQWLPVALAPILLAQLVSASGRVPLSAMFRYLRKLRREDPSVRDPLIDTSAVYLAVVLLAAGVANVRGPAYYAGIVVAAGWALYAIRPAHASLAAWAFLLGVGAAGGYAGYAGLQQIGAQIEAWVSDWQLRSYAGDPYRSTTDIGTLGKLKLLDAIVLRVFATPRDATRLQLLHRASYNTYVGNTWLARYAPMEAIAADAGGANWTLGEAPPDWQTRMATRLERGRILLALPSTTTRLSGLPANTMRRNSLGAVHADLAGDWIQFGVETAAGAELAGGPAHDDYMLPVAERAIFEAAAAELGLRGMTPAEALRRVREYFAANFTYSLWREHPPPEGMTPLGEFMRNTHAGHCEYFAAATALLLRAGGIPARYATGFAVVEYSPLEGAFVVRARHAHAWARAWVDGRWAEVDTTPPSWFAEEEESLAPFWQRLADLARWAQFRWSQRSELEASDWWYVLLALLAVTLAWRLLRGRRVARQLDGAPARARAWPGLDSEFYTLEKALPPREASETLAHWFSRIGQSLPTDCRALLEDSIRLHQCFRFDPLGLDPASRERLRSTCALLARALRLV